MREGVPGPARPPPRSRFGGPRLPGQPLERPAPVCGSSAQPQLRRGSCPAQWVLLLTSRVNSGRFDDSQLFCQLQKTNHAVTQIIYLALAGHRRAFCTSSSHREAERRETKTALPAAQLPSPRLRAGGRAAATPQLHEHQRAGAIRRGRAAAALGTRWAWGEPMEHGRHGSGKGHGTVAVSVGQLPVAGAAAVGEPVPVWRTSCAAWMKLLQGLERQTSSGAEQAGPAAIKARSDSGTSKRFGGIPSVPVCRPTGQPGSPTRQLQRSRSQLGAARHRAAQAQPRTAAALPASPQPHAGALSRTGKIGLCRRDGWVQRNRGGRKPPERERG